MLRESLLGVKARVDAENEKQMAEQQIKKNEYNKGLQHAKAVLDWLVYTIYKQICDNIADDVYRSGKRADITGCLTPVITTRDIYSKNQSFFTDEVSLDTVNASFSTSISLDQVKCIYDGADTGYNSRAFYDITETYKPAVTLSTCNSSRSGLGIIGYTDTEHFSLTKASALVVNEVVRLGRKEGITIIPGVVFQLHPYNSVVRTGEEVFITLRENRASYRHSYEHHVYCRIAFKYIFSS